MATSRRIRTSAIALVSVAAAAFVVDSGLAMHAEYNLSKRIEDSTDLPVTPSVKIGGLAYASSFFTGKWSSLTVRARDVEMPDFGLVSLEMGAANISVPASSVWSGDFGESRVKQYFTKLQLDGLSLGRKMNFTDLVIQNLDDISPAGGWETEALFEATPEGWSAPVQAAVKLRIKERTVHISPDHIVSGPQSRDDKKVVSGEQLSASTIDEFLKAFTLTMRGSELPLGLTPTRIYVTGGSVTIEGEQIQCTVVPENFMPAQSSEQQARDGDNNHLGPKNCWVRQSTRVD